MSTPGFLPSSISRSPSQDLAGEMIYRPDSKEGFGRDDGQVIMFSGGFHPVGNR